MLDRWRSHLILALAALCLPVAAPGAEPAAGAWSVFFENDSLYEPSNEDRDYTMGLGLRYSASDAGPAVLRRALARLDGALLPRWAPAGRGIHSVEVGSTNFTPEDLANPDPIPGDHPYASLLYLGLRRMSVGADDFRRSDLDLGVLGLTAWPGGRSSRVRKRGRTPGAGCSSRRRSGPLGRRSKL